MDNNFNKIKMMIRINYFNKNYYPCINLCKRHLKLIRKQHRKFAIDTRDELFFINFYVGAAYKKMSKWKISKYFIQKSIRYSLNDTYLNLAIKQLSEWNTQLQILDKAINNYEQLLHFYNKIGDIKNRADTLFNIARIKDKPNHMRQIIYALERLNTIDEYYELITNQYIDLIQYLSNHQQEFAGQQLLNNIQNINIKTQVCQKLYREIA